MSQHKTNLSLKKYNTFGLEVYAQNVVFLSQWQELAAIENRKNCLILGGGSNVLFTQDPEQTVIINQTKGIYTVAEDQDHVELAIASGENWHQLVLWCIHRGYGGLENMSLIPGSVGAAPMQNIGAYGAEIKDVLTFVKAIDLVSMNEVRFANEECQFGYRESIFKKQAKGNYFISSIGIKLTKRNHKLNTSYGDIENHLKEQNITAPTLADVSNTVIAIRQSKLPDPAILGNSGSFFKNPIITTTHLAKLKIDFPDIKSYPINEHQAKVPAGWLIESLGWKGKQIGNTGSHAKQALVLVNYGNAKGQEVYNLAKEIQKSVQNTYAINLEMEVNVV